MIASQLAWVTLILGLMVGESGEGADFEVRFGVRQLFLDDAGIESKENVERVMHRPVKRGAVLRSPDPEKVLQIRTAPAWDNERRRYILWVLSAEPNVWQSEDGLNWSPLGSSNIPIEMAILDPNERDRSRRFKAPIRDEGFAVSSDGLTWTMLEVAKIPSSDEANFSHDASEGQFIHTVKRGGPNGRALAIAESKDFENWVDHGIVFHADEEDQRVGRRNIESRLADPTFEPQRYVDEEVWNVDVYNMGVFRYEGMYIGLPTMYHATGRERNYPNTDGFDLIELASSRDLITWDRLGDRRPFLAPSRVDSGAYDMTQLLSPSSPVVHGEELWFYYTGLKYRSTFDYEGTYPDGRAVPVRGRSEDIGGVCLAVLRRDGFISLDAGDAAGQVVTRRFVVPNGQLMVNVDASSGELVGEVVSEEGAILARSRLVSGDKVRQLLEWEAGDLESLVGRGVSLRFRMRQSSIYSYWFEP